MFDTNILLLLNNTSVYLVYFKKNIMQPEKNPEKILMYLKMNGPQSAATLAKEFVMTGEGMRLHLLKLEENGFVKSEPIAKGVGRPIILYHLTKKGDKMFPDNHAALSVQLMKSIQEILGEDALRKVVDAKREKDYMRYQNLLSEAENIEEKIDSFTKVRSEEGYMAEWIKQNDEYYFIENHCPICAAATQNQGFCQSEFDNIKKLLGEVKLERIDHTVNGDRRCAYRIKIDKFE